MKTTYSVFWKELSVVAAMLYAVVFSCVLAVLDVNNLPSHYLMKYGTKMVVIICTASILVLALLLIKTHLLGMLRIPCGNTLDEALLTLIFVKHLILVPPKILIISS